MRRRHEPTRSPDGPSRRRLLAGLLLAAPALAACSLGTSEPGPPDPLVALADAARADAALADAAMTTDPSLTEQLEPLRGARVEHAAALDAEVGRLDPSRTPTPAATTAPAPVTLATVRESAQASAAAAAAVAMALPPERVGLVASVSACCATYATVLA